MKRKVTHNVRMIPGIGIKREQMRVMLTICGVSFKVWASCPRVPFPPGDLKTPPTCPSYSSYVLFPPRQIHIEQATDAAKTRITDEEERRFPKDNCGKDCMGSIVAQDVKKRVSTSTQTHKHPRCSLL